MLAGGSGRLWPVVAALPTESMNLWLLRGAGSGGSAAQLLGFRSRVLQAAVPSSSSHLYVAEWERCGDAQPTKGRLAAASTVMVGFGGAQRGRGSPLEGEHIDASSLVLCVGATLMSALSMVELELPLLLGLSLAGEAVPVWLVTHGAMRPTAAEHAAQPMAVGSWGAARSARLEVPSAQLACIDLDGATQLSERLCAGAWLLCSSEPELALKGRLPYAPRLGRAAPSLSGAHAVVQVVRRLLEADAGSCLIVVTGGNSAALAQALLPRL